MLKLQIVTASTRVGRKGPAVATWFIDFARKHGQFDVEPVDLTEINLPMFDEPQIPRLRQYEHDYTKVWSTIIDRADAYVFVTPEYNFSAPPSLINAFDYLFQEWNYKPAAFVSYGGTAGGARGVQVSRQIATSLRMVPIPEAIAIPLFIHHINKETGVFDPGGQYDQAATIMLTELYRWASALKPLRS